MLPSELDPNATGTRVYLDGPTVQTNEEFKKMLKDLGAVQYDLWLPETNALPGLIHPNEKIKGLVYGRYQRRGNGGEIGRGALIATDQRVLLLDKKPFYIRCDELNYMVVSGVSYAKAGLAGTVTLHTNLGDIYVRTFNQKCARKFVEAIENSLLREGGNANANY